MLHELDDTMICRSCGHESPNLWAPTTPEEYRDEEEYHDCNCQWLNQIAEQLWTPAPRWRWDTE